jgi:methyl-accepting chemotaxis protein
MNSGGDGRDCTFESRFSGKTADDLTVAAEQTSAAINEMGASIEEVSSMSENRARLLTRLPVRLKRWLVQSRAFPKNTLRITDETTSVANSAAEMDRSMQAVASMAQNAHELTTRVARDAE